MIRSIWLVVLTCLIAAGAARAEAPYRKGDRALSFSFDGADLGSFDGGVGGKYWFSDQWAAIGVVDIGYRSSDDNYEERESRYWRDRSAGLAVGFERHYGKTRFTPYIGAGLGGSYNDAITETSPSGGDRKDITEKRYYGASARVGFGAEFWLTPRFSLGGEYRLEVYYTDGWTESRREGETEIPPIRVDKKTWQTDVFASRLVLSVYL